MKKLQKIGLPLIMLCLMLAGVLNVSAADNRAGQVVDGSVLTAELSADGIAYPTLRGVYFASGTARLSITGVHQIQIVGTTTAYQDVESVKVSLIVQRLEGENWIPVYTWGPRVAHDTNQISTSKTYTVDGGYYYRVFGNHTVIEGDYTEGATSYTNGIWVN